MVRSNICPELPASFSPPRIPLGRKKKNTRQGVIKSHRISRSEEHTSELQSPCNLECRLLLEKKKQSSNLRKRYRVHSISSLLAPLLACVRLVLARMNHGTLECIARGFTGGALPRSHSVIPQI